MKRNLQKKVNYRKSKVISNALNIFFIFKTETNYEIQISLTISSSTRSKFKDKILCYTFETTESHENIRMRWNFKRIKLWQIS